MAEIFTGPTARHSVLCVPQQLQLHPFTPL